MKKLKKGLVFSAMLAIMLCCFSVGADAKTVKTKSLKLNKSVYTLQVGKQTKLKATVAPKKATNKTVVFTSSKTAVATVNEKGIVKAKKKGVTVITAKVKGTKLKKKCKITVGTPVKKLTLSTSEVTIVEGTAATVSAKITPKKVSVKGVTFTSKDKSVATVTQKGVITGVKAGSTKIIVASKDGTKKKNITVTVKSASLVTNQAELDVALANASITNILIQTQDAVTLQIPAGDYGTKTLTIDAPKAEINNYGKFAFVEIKAVAGNSYNEYSNNTITVSAATGRIHVQNAAAPVITVNAPATDLKIENDGRLQNVYVQSAATVDFSGDNTIPVTVESGAANSNLSTSTTIDLALKAWITLNINAGGENSTATATTSAFVPAVNGYGYLPVSVTDINDVINVVGKNNGDSSLKTTISGSAYGISLDAEGELVNEVLANTTVYLIRYDAAMNSSNVGGYLASCVAQTTTDASGNYSFADTSIGNYAVVAAAAGYTTGYQTAIIDSTRANSIYSCERLTLLDSDISGNYPVTGTLTDASTGECVPAGLTVKIRNGSGSIVEAPVATTTSSESGVYEVASLPAGIYTVEVLDLRTGLSTDAVKYTQSTFDIVVYENGSYNGTVSRQLAAGAFQFTLTWGSEAMGAESDLDSHIMFPTLDLTTVEHIDFTNKVYRLNGTTVADLDVDDTTYEGPEHVTVYQQVNGTYAYFIDNYSKKYEDGISRSQATVVLTVGGRSTTFHAPSGNADCWYVCNYNPSTGVVTNINQNYESKSALTEYIKNTYFPSMNEASVTTSSVKK